jgi:hypothetical protein
MRVAVVVLLVLCGCETERDFSDQRTEAELDGWLATLPVEDAAAQAEVTRIVNRIIASSLSLEQLRGLVGPEVTVRQEGAPEVYRDVVLEGAGDRRRAIAVARTLATADVRLYSLELGEGTFRLHVMMVDPAAARPKPAPVLPQVSEGWCFKTCAQREKRIAEKTALLRKLEGSRLRLRQLQLAEREFDEQGKVRFGRDALPLLAPLEDAEWFTPGALLVLSRAGSSIRGVTATPAQCNSTFGAAARCGTTPMPQRDGGVVDALSITPS